jgi:hypothetical protein
MLRGYIDGVCYLADQELPFGDHDGSSTSLNKGTFVKFSNMLKNPDPLLENHMNSANVI